MGINTYENLILYAEDSQIEQELFKQALKEHDFSFEVRFFNHGESLLNYLTKSESEEEKYPLPSLILLDWQMPVKSGLETLEILKQSENLKNIPVVIFSSHDDPEIINLAYQSFANAYIKKPLDYDDLPKILLAIENFWIKRVKLAHKHTDL
ncbi:MAG: response regulator [Bacteroidota bacterium]